MSGRLPRGTWVLKGEWEFIKWRNKGFFQAEVILYRVLEVRENLVYWGSVWQGSKVQEGRNLVIRFIETEKRCICMQYQEWREDQRGVLKEREVFFEIFMALTCEAPILFPKHSAFCLHVLSHLIHSQWADEVIQLSSFG